MKKLIGTLAFVFLGSLASLAHAAESKVLTIYNWADYIPQSVYQEFTKETGIEVHVSTFDSNEALFSKLKLLQKSDAKESFDLIGPSTYYVQRMAAQGMLHKLDHAKIPNLKNLESQVLNRPYDPGNQYCVPYVFGSTAIGLNPEILPDTHIDSWKQLWDPKWQGQLLLTDDPREVFQMALMVLGLNPNSQDPAEIKQAYEYLKKLMPNVLLFNADTPRMPYLSGDVGLGMLWSDSAFKALKDMPDLKYIYPKEGAIFWSDTLAIPKNAKHVDAAYKFINFILRPDIAAKILHDLGSRSRTRR
ncbi:ABC transporter substrate-binding protein [Dongshaea marina]|uniref:ABC transporter substrate-binding protein n=1 Tax=Dongshaea marina TaxID=2047966 RepID=UPI00131F2B6F|nr:extracellular solute-binding protein [Dongshaea marina]